MGPQRHPPPGWLQAACIALVLAFLVGAYLAGVHFAMQSLDATTSFDRRDAVYFGLHGASLALALVLGAALGRWLAGLAFAYAVLFGALMFVVMVSAQVGSYHLACSAGHNDLLRHWTCDNG